MDQIEVFARALRRHNHDLIIAGAEGHPLAQLRRTQIAQRLGPNMVPDMEFAMARAKIILAEQKAKAEKMKASSNLDSDDPPVLQGEEKPLS